MPITKEIKYANRISGGTTLITRSGTTGSIAYVAGTLVTVEVGVSSTAINSVAVSAPGWPAFVQRAARNVHTVGSGFAVAKSFIYTSVAPTTANHTITITTNGITAYNLDAVVKAWPGAQTTTFGGTGQNGAEASGDGAKSLTLSSGLVATSYVTLTAYNDVDPGANSMTPGASPWVQDANIAPSNYGNTFSQSRIGSTSTTCTINDVKSGTPTSFSWSMCALTLLAVDLPLKGHGGGSLSVAGGGTLRVKTAAGTTQIYP